MLDRKLYYVIAKILGEDFVTGYTEKFSTRIIVQKMLYLLTHGVRSPRVSLPYSWSFYLRGPYSPEIAHALYYVNEVFDEIPKEQVQLSTEETAAVSHLSQTLKLIEDQRKKRGISNSENVFEAAATLVYFGERKQFDKELLIQKLKAFKPNFYKLLRTDFLSELVTVLNENGYC